MHSKPSSFLGKSQGPGPLLPIGEGAFQNPEAVKQRTTDARRICEEAKTKGDYKDKAWEECYKLGGDYTDVRVEQGVAVATHDTDGKCAKEWKQKINDQFPAGGAGGGGGGSGDLSGSEDDEAES